MISPGLAALKRHLIVGGIGAMSSSFSGAAARSLGLAALVAAALAAGSGSAWSYRGYVVQYQCGGEEPKTFVYAAGYGPQYAAAPIEARMYWKRMRADKGVGCRVLTVNGVDLWVGSDEIR
jgi:hypothetical protein